jgi:hypothetical protein
MSAYPRNYIYHCNRTSTNTPGYFFLKDQEGGPLLRILLENEKKRLELSPFTNNKKKRIRKHYSYICHRLSQFGIEVSNFPRAL